MPGGKIEDEAIIASLGTSPERTIIVPAAELREITQGH